MKSEFNVLTTTSIFAPTNCPYEYQATIHPRDILNPWQSLYGFPIITGRLATNQKLVLHCREDEIFEFKAKLNTLLACPNNLNRAYALLKVLEQSTCKKLARLIKLKEPLSKIEFGELLEQVELLLAQPTQASLIEHLEDTLTANHPLDEILGTQKMLRRLTMLLRELNTVKDRGFRAVVKDRRRQPARPALEARRNESILHIGESGTLTVGFLLPKRYHLTLWAYQIVRDDHGHSAIWN